MSTQACPSCRADLDEDLISSTGRAECPFCGADLSHLNLEPGNGDWNQWTSPEPPRAAPAPTETPGTINFDDQPFGDQPEGVEEPAPSSATIFGANRPIPAGSRIQVVESTDDRQVIFLPAGGRTGGLGFFAFIWNGFMLVFTSVMAMSFKHKPGDPPLILLVLFLGLFWAVGYGLLHVWIRMRFTRTYILLDKSQLVVQRILFGRKKMTETIIGPESRASLVESYRENERPVYAVAVNGTNRTEKFGTALSQEEKEWFVDTINGFLGAAGIPAACEEILYKSGGEIVAPLAPTELRETSEITIDEATPDRLVFHLRVLPSDWFKKARRAVGCGFLLTMIFPHVVLLIFGAQLSSSAHAVLLLFPSIFVVFALFTIFARITVDLTRDRFICRWHWRRFGLRKTIRTDAITRVAIIRHVMEKQGRKMPRSVDEQNSFTVCVVFAGRKSAAISGMHNIETAREAGGLVRYQLERMGFQVDDA